MQAVYYFAVCLFITYGITASAFMMPLRIALAVRSAWLATLIYCPICVSFWVSFAFAWMYPEEIFWQRFIYGPIVFNAALVAVRTHFKDYLVSESLDEEWRAIADIIARRGEPPPTEEEQS